MTEPFDPKLSALYQRTPKDEPSEASDALVTQLAHDAVKQQRKHLWGAQWAVAATLVLAVGLSWQVWQQQAAIEVDSVVFDAPVEKKSKRQEKPAYSLQGSSPQADFAPAPPVLKQAREQSLEIYHAEQMRKRSQKALVDVPCGQSGLRFDTDPEKWRLEIALLQKQGDKVQAECLISAFEQRFGQWEK